MMNTATKRFTWTDVEVNIYCDGFTIELSILLM